jgi:hypothetical protein
MPFRRFRLRTMLIAVAISGLMAGFEAAGQRKAYRQKEANRHLRLAILYEGQARIVETDTFDDPRDLKLLRSLAKKANYHAKLYHKYNDASRRPCLSVPPDPREPE